MTCYEGKLFGFRTGAPPHCSKTKRRNRSRGAGKKVKTSKCTKTFYKTGGVKVPAAVACAKTCKTKSQQMLAYEDARAIVIKLQLTNREEWREWLGR